MLTDIALNENSIKDSTKEAIILCLRENADKRNEEIYSTSFVAAALENSSVETENSCTSDTDTMISSTVNDVYSTKIVSENDSESDYTAIENTLSNLTLNSTDRNDNGSDTTETSTIADLKMHENKHRKTEKGQKRKSKKVKPKVSKITSKENRSLPQLPKRLEKSEESDNKTDDEDDMGTLLIGKTMPGYYAYPVSFSSSHRHRHIQTLNGNIHPQNAAHMIYSD